MTTETPATSTGRHDTPETRAMAGQGFAYLVAEGGSVELPETD